jgi:hypothetical protein
VSFSFAASGNPVSVTPLTAAITSERGGTKASPWPAATAVAKPLRTPALIGLRAAIEEGLEDAAIHAAAAQNAVENLRSEARLGAASAIPSRSPYSSSTRNY